MFEEVKEEEVVVTDADDATPEVAPEVTEGEEVVAPTEEVA